MRQPNEMTDGNNNDRAANGEHPAPTPAAPPAPAQPFDISTWEGCRGKCAQCPVRKQCEDGCILEPQR